MVAETAQAQARARERAAANATRAQALQAEADRVKAARDTPGTVEHLMRGVDDAFGSDPDYRANRKLYANRLQRIASGTRGAPYTVAEARHYVGTDLDVRRSNAAQIAAEKAGQDPTKVGQKVVRPLPATASARLPGAGDLGLDEIEALVGEDGPTLTDVYDQTRARNRDAGERRYREAAHPGPGAAAASDFLGELTGYSRVFGQQGRKVASGVNDFLDRHPALDPAGAIVPFPGAGDGPRRTRRVAVQDAVGAIDAPGALGGMADAADALAQLADANLRGDHERAGEIVRGVVGNDGWETLGHVLGLLAGGKAMHVAGEAIGGALHGAPERPPTPTLAPETRRILTEGTQDAKQRGEGRATRGSGPVPRQAPPTRAKEGPFGGMEGGERSQPLIDPARRGGQKPTSTEFRGAVDAARARLS